mmetsp:Transcript_12244/g.17592  ORF Transcript_12244/g.17592 Transcript_12244/m.17592 type:complete len:124 (+) Transcript_12244:1590-1961(+)
MRSTTNVPDNPTAQPQHPPPQQQQPQNLMRFNNGNQNDRVLRQYQRERNFRLQRMMMRFPQYIRQDQVARWTSTTYNGSLVRDPSFTRHGSSTSAGQQGQYRGAIHGGGFGGGSSGGGRGASW